MPKPTTLEVVPNPARLITSLRDFGYELTEAIADLADNSLDAGATEIHIDVKYDAERSWIRLRDNGKGMTPEQLTEAMRYGADRHYSGEDKGKFGLGLKTASLSQCRRLSVATRMARSRPVDVRVLDLDHVTESRKWEIKTASDSEQLLAPMKTLKTGTVVLWENLDRVLQYKQPQGKRAEQGMHRQAEKIEAHLAMVFHRFLAGIGKSRKKLALWINGNPIAPWDPFAVDERHTKPLPEEEFEVASSRGMGVVLFRPYLLPTRDQFSSLAAFNRLAGPEKWNLQQGLYIYRGDRLVQCGGWCRMAVVDEHTKFARAALEFNSDLDEAFEINVTKTAIKLPSDLREQLEEHVRRFREQAKKAYSKNNGGDEGNTQTGRGRGGGRSAGPAPGPPPRSTSGGARGTPRPPDAPVKPKVSTREALEKSASNVGQAKALRSIVAELKSSFPGVANDLGW